MPIYDRPTKSLMADWAESHLKHDQVFSKADAVRWFAEHFPKIRNTTVGMHVEGMSVNTRARKHHSGIKPGSGHDLFYKLGSGRFRLWNEASDPAPLYKADIEKVEAKGEDDEVDAVDDEAAATDSEFAFERDLQNYLVKNLSRIEPGLRLYEEEGISGIEFPVGGRFIDILAVDHEGGYMVIELKVSRGYDRAIGQLLRYLAWVDQNMESKKKTRGIIVANEITTDLRLAASRVSDVRLMEYEISFELKPV